jgi:hypothetical protein
MDSDGTRFAAILETTSFLHDFKALHDSMRPWSVSCVLIVVSLNFKAFPRHPRDGSPDCPLARGCNRPFAR